MLYYIWLSLHTYGMFMYIYMIITTYIWNVYVYLYQYIYIWLCTERLTGFSPRIQMLGRRLDAPVCQSQKIVFIYIYIYFYIRIVLYVWYVYNKCVCVWDIYDIYITSQSWLDFIMSHQPAVTAFSGRCDSRDVWYVFNWMGKKARDRLGVFGSQNWKMCASPSHQTLW